MITVQILEGDDRIDGDDWFRPLQISSMSMSGGYSFKSPYAGTPENNAEWVKVKRVLGKPWFGETIKSFEKAMERTGLRYEFVRGDIPKSHRLDMRGYSDLSKLVA